MSASSESSPPSKGFATLLELAWPIVLARATQAVVGFCDALMVAPLGEEPLAAVTTGSLNVFAIIMLPIGAAFIVQSFAAQLRGRGELGAAKRYAWYGLGLAVASGLVGLLLLPFVPAALELLRYAPGVETAMVTYVSIRLLSVGAAVGAEALGNWYGGLGNTRAALVAGITTMVANVFLNYALIEPRFGLPGFGVAGAAWASVIASSLGCAVLLIGFLRGAGYVKLGDVGRLRFSEFGRMLRFGLPNGLNWFMEFAAFVLFINVVVGHLGTTVLAAFNVVLQINSISFMPAFGLSSAGAIMVGEAIGRRAHDEVWPIVKLTGKVAGVWMGSVGLVYLTVPELLMSVFESGTATDGALLSIGATMLGMSAIWQLFDAATMTLSEALRAAGDTTWCMAARLFLAWILFTPLSWWAVLELDGGVMTIMLSLVAYLFSLALLLALRFASGRWRSIELVSTEPAV